MMLARTQASRQFDDRELLQTFRLLQQQYGPDVGLMFTAMFWEQQERIVQLESRLAALEAKRK